VVFKENTHHHPDCLHGLHTYGKDRSLFLMMSKLVHHVLLSLYVYHVTSKFVEEMGWEVLQCLLYSSDLIPNDLNLFALLQQLMGYQKH
jgi:hypothetical protein